VPWSCFDAANHFTPLVITTPHFAAGVVRLDPLNTPLYLADVLQILIYAMAVNGTQVPLHPAHFIRNPV
jgi:hypothetical protein